MGLFYRVKKLFKSNQTRYGVSHVYPECKTKRVFGTACLEKSWYFIRKFAIISNRIRLLNFKNRPLSSGQEVIQIKSNSVWSILCVPRV